MSSPQAFPRLLVPLLLITPLLAGCTEASCLGPDEAQRVLETARTQLADPFQQPGTIDVAGTLNGTPLDLDITSDRGRSLLWLRGTIAGSPVDVRMEGALVSFNVSGRGYVGRDHAPGSDAEAFLDSYIQTGLPFTQAPAAAFQVMCVAGPGLQFILEDGDRRHALVVGLEPVQVSGVQHVTSQDVYTASFDARVPAFKADMALPRLPAQVTLEQVDYQEDATAYAFRWVVADGSWVPAEDLQVLLLDQNGTVVNRTPLPTMLEAGEGRHDFTDHAPAGLLSPGDVVTVAVARDLEVTMWDTWADTWADLTFT